tara:strand:- start:356 stop:640 length:285 start_codon:yes stop_codon:yes gene_type:complete
MKTGDTIYVVYTSGSFPTLHSHTIVERQGVQPGPGCDILMEDKRGIVHSSSRDRHSLTPKEAIARKIRSEQDSFETYQGVADIHKKAVELLKEM